jgi:hypothetical protein
LDVLRFCVGDTSLDGCCDAIHCGVDLAQALGAFLDWQVGQVDIDR